MCNHLTSRLRLYCGWPLIILFFLILLSSSVFANNLPLAHVVKGIIKASNRNEPMEGVNVMIKGTSTGTTTGRDGSFTITAQRSNDTLVVSSVGYVT